MHDTNRNAVPCQAVSEAVAAPSSNVKDRCAVELQAVISVYNLIMYVRTSSVWLLPKQRVVPWTTLGHTTLPTVIDATAAINVH